MSLKKKPKTNRFNIQIPQGILKDRKPFILNKRYNNILFISDIQCPFHDRIAVELALKEGLKQRVNCIVIGGDFVDFKALSIFLKDPNDPKLKEEIRISLVLLTTIRKLFKGKPIIFIEGNHEERMYKYICEHPILEDILNLEKVLEFKRLYITHINNRRVLKAGKLSIIHGHEIPAGGAFPARAMRLKTKENILFGHYNRSCEDITTKLSGEIFGGWAVGHLSEPNPDFYTYNEWVQGFAIIKIINKQGDFKVYNYKIFNGKIY